VQGEAIFISEDVSGYARDRLRLLRLACEQEGLDLRAFEGVHIVPPGELTPQSGDHYRVFTPFWQGVACGEQTRSDGGSAKAALAVPSAEGRLPKLSDLTADLR
jgi:deoxyribodipyrimidine photo-lyase